jgi:hypothetical protein
MYLLYMCTRVLVCVCMYMYLKGICVRYFMFMMCMNVCIHTYT